MSKAVFLDADDVGMLGELLAGSERVGLDTEFMRERTYYSQLCLVQVATGGGIYCIDPLGTGELAAAWSALMPLSWVVHSGRQDVEVVYQSAHRMPASVFDTQIAAALLGHPPQIGYAALVSSLFGITLAKSHTRADWSRRPLAPELIAYAAEDVEHLLPTADLLGEQLAEAGRLEWALEDSGYLLDEKLYRSDPEEAVFRLKGVQRLSGRARSAAARLAAWREREAEKRNRPRQWILSDAALLELAATAPGTRAALARVTDLPAGTVRRVGDQLLAVLADTAADAPLQGRSQRRPDERDRAKLAAAQESVASTAARLGITPEVLAPRKELTAIVTGARDTRALRGWRRALFGETLLEIVEA